MPGTFDHPETVRTAVGADDEEWADFLAAVLAVLGTEVWTVKQLLERVRSIEGPALPYLANSQPAASPAVIPLDVLPGDLASKLHRGDPIAKKLGNWLRNRDGRWAGNLTVRKAFQDRDKITYWRIEAAQQR